MSFIFEYSVLRYMHDAVTQEFVNIGVLLFSAEEAYLGLQISPRYKRVSQMFDGIEPLAYRRARRSVEKAAKRVAGSLKQGSLFEEFSNGITDIISKILPTNDAALSFADPAQGLTDDLDEELNYLFNRLVEFYAPKSTRSSRTDQEVWVEYVEAFRKRNILPHLTKVTIPTKAFNVEFQHAFKNERWHPIEPVSFDLTNKSYIQEKAAKWIGKAVSLATSNEVGTLYILSGKPSDPSLGSAYEAAKRGLEEMTYGIDVRFVEEDNLESFSDEFEAFIANHHDESGVS